MPTPITKSATGHHVPDDPIIPFIEGDGTGPDIWAAAVNVFDAAVHISVPVTVTLLLVTVAMAFLARTVPEMNIFILGFTLRIIIGLVVVILMLPMFEKVYLDLFEKMLRNGEMLLKVISGGS